MSDIKTIQINQDLFKNNTIKKKKKKIKKKKKEN